MRPGPLRAASAGLALVVAIAACGRDGAQAPAAAARPALGGALAGWNLLVLSVDTLRADHLNAYGYATRATSPAIDDLLGRGVLFEEANATRAATWPSLASMLTGQLPSTHGVIGNRYEFRDETVTLPERFQSAGYDTAAFLANMCKANHQGLDDFSCTQGRDMPAARRALRWIWERDEARPWFLWVHLFGGHGPYYNGGDLAATRLDPDYDGFLAPKEWVLDRVMEEGIELSERDLVHLNALYDAAILGTDHVISVLLAGLREAGQLERTAIVFLADHGEELYEHNRFLYHACSVYQTNLHVPLGMVAEGVLPAGARVAPPVSLVDVTPTLVELFGLAPVEGADGASLVPYLERPQAGGAGRPAFSEYSTTKIRTVRHGRWKLIDNPDEITPICVPDTPPDFYPIARRELYDLAADPGERIDVAAARPEEVRRLESLIAAQFANRAPAARQQLTEEDKRQLEALGYVAD